MDENTPEVAGRSQRESAHSSRLASVDDDKTGEDCFLSGRIATSVYRFWASPFAAVFDSPALRWVNCQETTFR